MNSENEYRNDKFEKKTGEVKKDLRIPTPSVKYDGTQIFVF